MNNSTYCYFGGGRLLDPEASAVILEMQKVVSRMNLSRGAIIHVSDKKQETWNKVGEKMFEMIGVKDITIFDSYKESAKYDFSGLENTQVFFIAGGMPDVFLNRIKELGILQEFSSLLKQDNIFVIGISAGALMLNKTCFISVDDDYPNEIVMDGLNVRSDFICEVHYEAEKYDLLKTALGKSDVIAVEENSAVFLQSNQTKAVGGVHFYKKQI